MSHKHLGHARPPARRRPAGEPQDAVGGGDIHLMGEPAWPAALAGDSAAAIGVALRAARNPRCGASRLAIAIAALESCANAGDPAATMVLNHLSRRPR